MGFFRIVACLMLVTVAGSAMAAEPWHLSKISKACSLTTQRDGRVVVVIHERDAQNAEGGILSLAFLSPALKAPPDAQDGAIRGVPVRLEFDTGELLEETAVIMSADDPTLAIFKNDQIQQQLDIVGKATRVRVTMEGRTDAFDLTGLGESMPLLLECAKSLRQ